MSSHFIATLFYGKSRVFMIRFDVIWKPPSASQEKSVNIV